MKTTESNIINSELVQHYTTDRVHISGHNTRQPAEKEVIASGLPESIKTSGQLTPGLGRPHPGIKDHIELAAGARRYVACKYLGIPYRVVVKEMTDSEFLDAILTENLQREDPDPEAEAELIRLRLAEGMAPTEIAARYGKSELWVKRRIKILNLSPKLLKHLKPGGQFEHFTTEMKERLGDLEHHIQERLSSEWNFRSATTVQGINDAIRGLSCSLEGQDWINDPDTAIAKCGPGCENSTKTSLFRDPKDKSCGECLNGACFRQRRQKAIEKAIGTALGDLKPADVVFFTKDWCSGLAFNGKEIKPLDRWAFKDRYTVSKKKTDLVGVNVTDCLKPTRVWLVAVAKTSSASPANKSQVGDSREDKLTGKRLAAMNQYLKENLEKAPRPAQVPIVRLAAVFGTSSNHSFCMSDTEGERWKSLTTDFVNPLSIHDAASANLTPEDALWFSVRSVIKSRLTFHTNKDLLVKWKRKEMTQIAELIGFDYDAEWIRICNEDHPVPKSWGPGIDPVTLKPSKPAKAESAVQKLEKAAAAKPAKKAAKKGKAA